jgi:hypothetical protein
MLTEIFKVRNLLYREERNLREINGDAQYREETVC